MPDDAGPATGSPATPSGAPQVSVILPTRNRAGSLGRALESARSQEGVFEILVIDDASTDGTRERLAAAARRDARIRVLRQPERQGAAAARNRGADEASAPFLAFLDDDDEWLPGKISRQLDTATASGAGVVSCGFAEVAPDGTTALAGRVDLGAAPARATLVRGNVLGMSATMVRRDAFRSLGGFDTRLPRLQDWDLWIRLAGHTAFAHVPDTLAVVHRSAQSISGDAAALVHAADILAAKHAPAPGEGLTPAEHADLLLSLARLLVRDGEDRSGRRWAARALAAWPWAPRRVAAGALMSLAPGLYRRATAALLDRGQDAARSTPPARGDG